MTRRTFNYNSKARDVLVTEESDKYLKGIDLSYAKGPEREAIIKLADSIDTAKWKDQDLAKEDVKRLKESGALAYFRNFKKELISE